MKLIFCVFVVTLLVACAADPVPELPKVQSFGKTYVGMIDGNYPIVMRMTSTEGAINGSYFSSMNGVDLILFGTLNLAGELSMDEYNHLENVTGTFRGEMEGDKIEGEWTSADQLTVVDFNLTETMEDYDTILEKTLAYNLLPVVPIVSGVYTGELRRRSNNRLVIKTTGESRQVRFSLETSESSNLTCEGEVIFNARGNAVFKAEGCEHITFQLERTGITVMDNDACELHGTRRNYSGFYMK